MWRREEQEVKRFTFRLTTKGRDEDAEMMILNTGAGRRKPRVEVTIVGVKPATFNTATFLQRDSEKKRSLKDSERDEEAQHEEDGGKDNKTLFCVTSHVVWRTSQLMASWMASHASLFAPSGPLVSSGRGLRVLELGCGLGLAGLTCAKVCAALRRPDTPSAEPALVVMTDGDAAALQLLEHNVDLNWTGMPSSPRAVAQLLWGDRPCMRQLKATHGGQPFDVVLGADIIYHRTDYEALIDTIGFFLSRDDSNQREVEQQPPGSITNENALVIIAMQERHYGALDHLVQLMRTRLGMAARTLDVPRMLGDRQDEAERGSGDEDRDGDGEGDDAQDGGGGYIGSNHYMVVFHHPRTTLELDSLGPEVVNEGFGDEEDLLLSLSPP